MTDTNDPAIDGYVAELEERIRVAESARSANVSTNFHAVFPYDQTKRDRLWRMKVAKQDLDSVLICHDGHREMVHMDIIREIEDRDTVPFYKMLPTRSEDNLHQYQVDQTVPSNLLIQIVYFAYNLRCELTEELAMSLAECAHEFGIVSLLEYTLTYLREHIRVGIAVDAFELAFLSSVSMKQDFQDYVEDNFEQIWVTTRPAMLSLTYETLVQLLSSDWLNVISECTVWQVVEAWVGHDPATRLTQLSTLIKETLRFGRFPSSFSIEESILTSDVFLSQTIELRQDTSKFMTQMLNEANRTAKPLDGNGLPYDESVHIFRPRKANQLLIVAGDWRDDRRSLTQSIHIYDYQLNQWRDARVKLPQAMFAYEMQVIGSIIYLFGGFHNNNFFGTRSLNNVYSLDLSQAEPVWTALPPMHTPRYSFSSVVYKDKLIAFGGCTVQNPEIIFPQSIVVPNCEQYDPISRVWTVLAPLNLARINFSATVHKDLIYVAGGCHDDSTMEVYNPALNHWQLVEPMSRKRIHFALLSYDNRVLAVGGYLEQTSPIESYDPVANVWTNVALAMPLPMKINCACIQGVLLNGCPVVIDPNGHLCTIKEYDGLTHLIRLCSREIKCSSLAVVSNRIAAAFHNQ